jgi:hypothetical protein
LVSLRAAGEIAQLSGYLVGIEADYYMPCGQAATRFTSFSAARIDLTGLLTSGFLLPRRRSARIKRRAGRAVQ